MTCHECKHEGRRSYLSWLCSLQAGLDQASALKATRPKRSRHREFVSLCGCAAYSTSTTWARAKSPAQSTLLLNATAATANLTHEADLTIVWNVQGCDPWFATAFWTVVQALLRNFMQYVDYVAWKDPQINTMAHVERCPV